MHQPQGFIHPDFPDHVCRLKKSLYGFLQAPRAWFSPLIEKLQSYGFQVSKVNTSLYTLRDGKLHLLVLIFVDDIIVTGSNSSAITRLITRLSLAFPV